MVTSLNIFNKMYFALIIMTFYEYFLKVWEK